MNITNTPFEDLVVLEPRIFEDERGFFFESYNNETLLKSGLRTVFVQDNQSHSQQWVIRGLHFQHPPFEQTKLVRVLNGVIQDVVVDMRKDQPTYKKSFSIVLSSENKKQLWVPKGFAHGFLVISEFADVLYKCDEHYHPEAEGGIFYDDKELSIIWQLEGSKVIISSKDLILPLSKDVNYEHVSKNRI